MYDRAAWRRLSSHIDPHGPHRSVIKMKKKKKMKKKSKKKKRMGGYYMLLRHVIAD